MKTTLIVIILVSIICICNAEVSMIWEKDLSVYIGSDDGIEMLQLPDDSICIAGVNWSDSSPWDILVYDSDGNNQMHGTYPRYELDFFLLSSVPGHFAIGSSDGGPLLIYELQDESYSLVESGTYDGVGGSRESSINSKYFYAVEDSMLRKFKMNTPPAEIDGAVASGIDGSNYILHWNSENGVQYQIQSSVNLTNWVDVGSPVVGTGSPLTWANALTNSKSFFRVINN